MQTQRAIKSFINNFKKGFDESHLVEVFTQGNCYHFAVILNNIFDGHIVHDNVLNHFMFMDRNYNIYDITGTLNNIDVRYLYSWDMMEDKDYLHYNELYYWCVELKER